MIAIKILKQKDFMAKLLTSDIFDNYLVNELTIETYNTFHIDGKINKAFYDNNSTDEDDSSKTLDNYSTWSTLRPICLDLIKGKRTPLGFKFIFYLKEDSKTKIINSADSDLLPEQVNLGLNVKFTGSEMQITTGCAYNIFTLEKEIEKKWDEYIPRFLDNSNIEYEIL